MQTTRLKLERDFGLTLSPLKFQHGRRRLMHQKFHDQVKESYEF
jgi:hypothetical protein